MFIVSTDPRTGRVSSYASIDPSLGSKIVTRLDPGSFAFSFDHMRGVGIFAHHTSATDTFVELPFEALGVVREELAFFFEDVSRRRGVLVHGAPGNGKTRMVLELAREAAVERDAVVLVNVEPGYVRQAVELVRASDPARSVVVVWDEFDSFLAQDEYQLLRLLDGSESVAGVMYLAILNDLSLVPDRIYRRPSRFGAVVELGEPSFAAREKYLASFGFSGETLSELALLTEGLSLDYVKEIATRVTLRGHTVREAFERLGLLFPGMN